MIVNTVLNVSKGRGCDDSERAEDYSQSTSLRTGIKETTQQLFTKRTYHLLDMTKLNKVKTK